MKKHLVSMVCAGFCVLLAFTACTGCLGETAETETGRATRTILLYDCGSDLEASYALATWKSVILEQGAEAGVYSIVVSVIGGAEDTYANIEPETFVIEVE